jgi:hypothetical protein
MTQFIIVRPGQSNVVTSGPQFGVPYTILGADGSRAVFNDPGDPDYVGWLSNASGFDSPEVREYADELVGDDGGVHGQFLYGRRPITLEGQIDNNPQGLFKYVRSAPILNEAQNPSFERYQASTPTGWTPFSNAGTSGNIARSSDLTLFTPRTGSVYAYHQGTNGAGAGTQAKMMWGVPVSVTTGEKLLLSFKGKRRYGGTQLELRYRNNSGAVVTTGLTSIAGGQLTTTGTSETIFKGLLTVPSGVTTIQITAYLAGVADSNPFDYRVDGFQIVRVPDQATAESLPYFDGDFVEGTGYEVEWVDDPNTSSSRLYSVQEVALSATEARNLRMTKLARATNAMTRDSTIRWLPDGGVPQQLHVRRQQPLRIEGAFNKTFQLAMVASDPRIYAEAVKTTRVVPGDPDEYAMNDGTTDTKPVVVINGPITDPTIQNYTAGKSLSFSTANDPTNFPGAKLNAGDTLVIDMQNKTVMLNGTINVYSAVVFESSEWWTILPGQNTIRLLGTNTSSATNAQVRWSDAWV